MDSWDLERVAADLGTSLLAETSAGFSSDEAVAYFVKHYALSNFDATSLWEKLTKTSYIGVSEPSSSDVKLFTTHVQAPAKFRRPKSLKLEKSNSLGENAKKRSSARKESPQPPDRRRSKKKRSHSADHSSDEGEFTNKANTNLDGLVSPRSDGVIFDTEGQIEAATPEAILKCFEDSIRRDSEDDLRMVDQAILTYPYFSTRQNILSSIIEGYRAAQTASDQAFAQQNILGALNIFLRFDKAAIVSDLNLLATLENFLGSIKESHSQSLVLFLQRSLKSLSEPSIPRHDPSLSPIPQEAESFPPIEMMARQIALLEQTYYVRVKAAHLIKNAFVNQSARENASVQWTEHTNMFGRWIATRILRQPSKSLRAKMISKFITLAEELQTLKCFSGMMHIYMTLNMFCITRLKSSWKYVSRSLRTSFENLSSSLKPLSNFAGYREMLAQASGSVVPYLAVVTKDLANLHELPSRSDINSSHLNWHKLSTTARVLRQFLRFQQSPYQFEREPDILNELFHLDALNLIAQDDLLSISQAIEVDGDSSSPSSLLFLSDKSDKASKHKSSEETSMSLSSSAPRLTTKSLSAKSRMTLDEHRISAAKELSDAVVRAGTGRVPATTFPFKVPKLLSDSALDGVRLLSPDCTVAQYNFSGSVSLCNVSYNESTTLHHDSTILQQLCLQNTYISLHHDGTLIVCPLRKPSCVKSTLPLSSIGTALVGNGSTLLHITTSSSNYVVRSWTVTDNTTSPLSAPDSFKLPSVDNPEFATLPLKAQFCRLVGNHLLLASTDSWQLWDIKSGKFISKKKEDPIKQEWTHLEYSGGGFVAAAYGSKVSAWSAGSGGRLYSVTVASPITALHCDATGVILGDSLGEVIVRSHEAGKPHIGLPTKVGEGTRDSNDAQVTCVGRRGEQVIAGRHDGIALFWNLFPEKDPALVRSIDTGGAILSLKIARDSASFLVSKNVTSDEEHHSCEVWSINVDRAISDSVSLTPPHSAHGYPHGYSGPSTPTGYVSPLSLPPISTPSPRSSGKSSKSHRQQASDGSPRTEFLDSPKSPSMSKSSSSGLLSHKSSFLSIPEDENATLKDLVHQLQSHVQNLQHSVMEKDKIILSMQKEIRELHEHQAKLENRLERQKRKSGGTIAAESDR